MSRTESHNGKKGEPPYESRHGVAPPPEGAAPPLEGVVPRFQGAAPPPPSPARRLRRPLVLAALAVVMALVGSAVAYVVLSGEVTPSGLRVTGQGFESIAIAWEWEAEEPPRGFVVTRDGREIAEVSGTETRYVDTGLEPSSEHRYAVAAELEEGVGEPSPELTARTTALPPPANLRVTDESFESVTLAWGWPGDVVPDTFVVNRDGVEIARLIGEEMGYRDATPKPGHDYRYAVVAEYGAASSDAAPEVTASTPKLPPLSQADLSGSYRTVVRWTSQSGFESIRVGTQASATWTFTAQRRGARLNGFLPGGGSVSMRLRGSGRTYRGTARASLSNCAGLPVTDTAQIVIRLRAADVRFDEWVATRWTGTLDVQSPPATNGIFSCAAGSFAANLEGRATS